MAISTTLLTTVALIWPVSTAASEVTATLVLASALTVLTTATLLTLTTVMMTTAATMVTAAALSALLWFLEKMLSPLLRSLLRLLLVLLFNGNALALPFFLVGLRFGAGFVANR